MTRKEGRRGTRKETVRVCLLLALLWPTLSSPSNAWTIGGRLGAELDGLGESQQFYNGIDPVQLESPTLTRKTTTQALIELRTESEPSHGLFLRLSDTARLANARSRNSLVGETTWMVAANRLRFEGQWDLLAGPDEPAAGSNGAITGTWDRGSLPLGLKSQVRIGADWSKTSNGDLAQIFDYRTLRGHVQLSRGIGSRMEIRALGGYRHKDAYSSDIGTYDESTGEIELSGEPRVGDRLDATAEVEDRNYRSDVLGVPSSVLATFTSRYEVRASESLHPYLDQTVEAQNYRGESGIFQDHRSWKAELGTDIFLSRLRHLAAEDTLIDGLPTDWRLRIGGTTEILRASSVDADSASFLPAFDSFGGVVGIAREGGESFWFDLSVEAGRRVYRDHVDTLHLVFEGLNLSLASSDYTYLGASLIAQWSPVRWLRAEAFMQWDDERHDQSQDNFRLWIANLSLTYPF